MPNNHGPSPDELFYFGKRLTSLAQPLAILEFFFLVIGTGILSTYGLNGTLWALWGSIFWANLTLALVAFGAHSQNKALYLALTGTKGRLLDEIRERDVFIDDKKGA